MEIYTKAQVDQQAAEISQRLAKLKRFWTILQSDFTFNTTSIVKIPDLILPVQNGETWRFRFGLRLTATNANADMRLQVTGPASDGFTSYQNLETAVSRTPTWGVVSASSPLATITNSANADLFYAEGWMLANADGLVEIGVRNNSGANSQIVGRMSWLEAYQVD